jgi:hypothetical protein
MMELFKPPTDNLYKFMALGGIVLFVAGVFVPPMVFQQTGMEYLAKLRGSDELRVHEEFTNQRLETLNLRAQRAIEEKNKLQKRLDELNSASNSAAVDKLDGQIKAAHREIESIEDSSHELSLNLALKRAQIKYEDTVSVNRRLISRVVLVAGWGLGLFGLIVSVIGFYWWYKHLQRFQDRLVAQEAEAQLGATTESNKQIEQKAPIQPTEVTVGKPTQPTQVDVPQPTK